MDTEDRLTEAEAGAETRKPGRPVRPKPGQTQAHDDRDDNMREDGDGRDAVHMGDVDISDAERLKIFEESLITSVLPDIPSIPGFHVCWLTESNLRDSIARRERIGYTPVSRSELRGWTGGNLKSASPNDDLVRINEMIAYKIPLRLYNAYMRHVHHELPLQEEGKLRAKIDELKEQSASAGARLDEGDGMAELGKRVRQMPELSA